MGNKNIFIFWFDFDKLVDLLNWNLDYNHGGNYYDIVGVFVGLGLFGIFW